MMQNAPYLCIAKRVTGHGMYSNKYTKGSSKMPVYPCILHKKCYNITKADAVPENRPLFKGKQTDKAIAKEHYSMRALNLTLLTDLYELTMMQGYFKNPTDQVVVFDAFYRKIRVTEDTPLLPDLNRSLNISVTSTFPRMTLTISDP